MTVTPKVKPDTVKVTNTTLTKITLHAEDTDSMSLPPGKHRIQTKFLWNLPATVKVDGARPPVVSSVATPPRTPPSATVNNSATPVAPTTPNT